MKLVLIKGDTEMRIELPPEILQALWDERVTLTPTYIGWCPQSGILSTADGAGEVMGPGPRHAGPAGTLGACLVGSEICASKETLGEKFQLYRTFEERQEERRIKQRGQN